MEGVAESHAALLAAGITNIMGDYLASDCYPEGSQHRAESEAVEAAHAAIYMARHRSAPSA